MQVARILLDVVIDRLPPGTIIPRQLGFGLANEHLTKDVASHAVTMIGDNPNVDILTRAWNLTWEAARSGVRTFDVEDVPVPAASVADLIESKRTGLLQNAADIEILEEIQQRLGA